MNNHVDIEVRLRTAQWLKEAMQVLGFYNRRGKHYLIREFAKFCTQQGAPIDEASLGRYIRDYEEGAEGVLGVGPVLPTPERCRTIAKVFEIPAVRVLAVAGYIKLEDMDQPKQTAAMEGITVPALHEDIERLLTDAVKAARKISANGTGFTTPGVLVGAGAGSTK